MAARARSNFQPALTGYDNVRVEEIADYCGVSPRTIFRYFGTKEDVLFAGTEARRMLLLHAIEAQPPGLSAFRALERACRTVAEDYAADLHRRVDKHRAEAAGAYRRRFVRLGRGLAGGPPAAGQANWDISW